MTKLRKVYLPGWMAWFVGALMVPVWAWVTYRYFFTGTGGSEMSLAVWIMTTVVVLVVLGVVVAMTRQKLPAYLIEEESGGSGGDPAVPDDDASEGRAD